MATKQHLVCEHLENISRDALGKYRAIIRRYLRRRQGVYALYKGNELHYVGLAGSLRSRLKTHLKDQHRDSWDRFNVYLTIGDSHLRELEALVLRIVRPEGNRQKGKLPGSDNLRHQLDRDIRAHQREERLMIFNENVGPDDAKVDRKSGRRPVLATLIDRPTRLRANYKGKVLKARVRRDGRIIIGNKVFTSPSLAGKAARGTKAAVNGWLFWKYERTPGNWVLLDDLRQ